MDKKIKMNDPALKGEVSTQGYKTMKKQDTKIGLKIKLGEARQFLTRLESQGILA